MKKVVLIPVLLLVMGAMAFADQTASNEASSAHYQVYSARGASDAQAIAKEMEAYFHLFNSYFHFDPSTFPGKLHVRIYGDKSAFEQYLSTIVPGKRSTFVYLQYSNPARSVLVGYHEQNQAAFQRDLIHHGFVQFLRSFVPHPPLWLQEGFAVYFEKTSYDPSTGVATFHRNLAWLPTLKKVVKAYAANDTAKFIAPTTLFTIDAADANKKIDAFYAESWGLVSFFVHSGNKNFNRVLWDAIAALKPGASATGNQRQIQKNAFDWVSMQKLEAGFKSYVETAKTFPELVQAGMSAYSSGNMKNAKAEFKKAIALNGKNYVPYYYLGLVSYDGQDYYLAEQYFQTALQMGGNAGLINYALGINAFADNRIADAKKFLTKATSVQSDYKSKAASLLDKIKQQSSP